jgi:inactive phospholipase C-like protein 2
VVGASQLNLHADNRYAAGYRHITLLNNEGDPLENCTLFVHVAITNRRGGGVSNLCRMHNKCGFLQKAKKRGMSVKRKTERVHTGVKMIGLKQIDELFKAAVVPLAECIEMRNLLEAATVFRFCLQNKLV